MVDCAGKPLQSVPKIIF